MVGLCGNNHRYILWHSLTTQNKESWVGGQPFCYPSALLRIQLRWSTLTIICNMQHLPVVLENDISSPATIPKPCRLVASPVYWRGHRAWALTYMDIYLHISAWCSWATFTEYSQHMSSSPLILLHPLDKTMYISTHIKWWPFDIFSFQTSTEEYRVAVVYHRKGCRDAATISACLRWDGPPAWAKWELSFLLHTVGKISLVLPCILKYNLEEWAAIQSHCSRLA